MKKGKGRLMKTVLAMCMSFLLVFTPVIGAAAPLVAESSGAGSGTSGLAGKTSSYFSSLFEGAQRGDRDFEQEFEAMAEDGMFDSVTESFNNFTAGIMEDDSIAGSLRETVYTVAEESEEEIKFADDPINALVFKVLTHETLRKELGETIGNVLLDEDLMTFLETLVADAIELLGDPEFEDFLHNYLMYILVDEDGLSDDIDELIFGENGIASILEDYVDELTEALDMAMFDDFIEELLDIVIDPYSDYIDSLLDEEHPEYNEDLGDAVARILENVTGVADDFITEVMENAAFENALQGLLDGFMDPAEEFLIDALLDQFAGPCGECGTEGVDGCLGVEEGEDPTINDCLENDGDPILSNLLPRILDLVGDLTYCGECDWCVGECDAVEEGAGEDGEDLTCQDEGHSEHGTEGNWCDWCKLDAGVNEDYKCEIAHPSFKALMGAVDDLLDHLNEGDLGTIGEEFDILLDAFLDSAIDLGGEEGEWECLQDPQNDPCLVDDPCNDCVAELEEIEEEEDGLDLMAILDIDGLVDELLGFVMEGENNLVDHLVSVLGDEDTMDNLMAELDKYLDDEEGEKAYIGDIITMANAALNHGLDGLLEVDGDFLNVLVAEGFAEYTSCGEDTCTYCSGDPDPFDYTQCDDPQVAYWHDAIYLIIGDPEVEEDDGIIMGKVGDATFAGYECGDDEPGEHDQTGAPCDGCANDECTAVESVDGEDVECKDEGHSQYENPENWCFGCQDCTNVQQQGELHIAMFGDRNDLTDGGAFEASSMEDLMDLVGDHTDIFVAVLMDYIGEVVDLAEEEEEVEGLLPWNSISDILDEDDIDNIVESLFSTIRDLDATEIFDDLDANFNRVVTRDHMLDGEDVPESEYVYFWCGCNDPEAEPGEEECDYHDACVEYEGWEYAYLMGYDLVAGLLDGIAEGLLEDEEEVVIEEPDEFELDPECAVACNPEGGWGALCADCQEYNLDPDCEEGCAAGDSWEQLCEDCQTYDPAEEPCPGPGEEGGCTELAPCLPCQIDAQMESLMDEGAMKTLYTALGGRFDEFAGWRVDPECDGCVDGTDAPCPDCLESGDHFYIFERKAYEEAEVWPELLDVVIDVIMEIVEDPYHPDELDYPQLGDWGTSVEEGSDPYSRLGAFMADVTGDAADEEDGGMIGEIMEDEVVQEYGQQIGGSVFTVLDRIAAPALQLLRPSFYVREYLEAEQDRLESFVDEDYISHGLWRMGSGVDDMVNETQVGDLPDNLLAMFIGTGNGENNLPGYYHTLQDILDAEVFHALGDFMAGVYTEDELVGLKAELFAEDIPETITGAGESIQGMFEDQTASGMAISFNELLAEIIPADDIEIRLFGVPCFQCEGCEAHLGEDPDEATKQALIDDPTICDLSDGCALVEGLEEDEYCEGCTGVCVYETCEEYGLPEDDWCAACQAEDEENCENAGLDCATVWTNAGYVAADYEYKYCDGCLGECANKTSVQMVEGIERTLMNFTDDTGELIESFLDYEMIHHLTGTLSYLLAYEGRCLTCDTCEAAAEQELCGGDPGLPAADSECDTGVDVYCLDCIEESDCELYDDVETQSYTVKSGIEEIIDTAPVSGLDFVAKVLKSEYPADYEEVELQGERILDTIMDEIIEEIFEANGPVDQMLDSANAVVSNPETGGALKDFIDDVVTFDVETDAGNECGVCDNCVCEEPDEEGEDCGTCDACTSDCLYGTLAVEPFDGTTLLWHVDKLIHDLLSDDILMSMVIDDILVAALGNAVYGGGDIPPYDFQNAEVKVLGVGLHTVDYIIIRDAVFNGLYSMFEMMEQWLINDFNYYVILCEETNGWYESSFDEVDFDAENGLPCGSCAACEDADTLDPDTEELVCTETITYIALRDLFGFDENDVGFVESFLTSDYDPVGDPSVSRLTQYIADPAVNMLVNALDFLTTSEYDCGECFECTDGGGVCEAPVIISEELGERLQKSLYYEDECPDCLGVGCVECDDGNIDVSIFGAFGEYFSGQAAEGTDLVVLIQNMLELLVYEDVEGKGGLLEKIGNKIDGNENLINISACEDEVANPGSCAECSIENYTECEDAQISGLIVEVIMIVEDILPDSAMIDEFFDDPDNFGALQTIIEFIEIVIDTDEVRAIIEMDEYCAEGHECPWCLLGECQDPDYGHPWAEGETCEDHYEDEEAWCDYCSGECTGEFGPMQAILDLILGEGEENEGIMNIFNRLSAFMEEDASTAEPGESRAYRVGYAVQNIPATFIEGIIGEDEEGENLMADLASDVVAEQFILNDADYTIGYRILNTVGDVVSNENTTTLVGDMLVDGVSSLYGFFADRFGNLSYSGGLEGDRSGGAELASDSPYDPYMLQSVPSLGMDTVAGVAGVERRAALQTEGTVTIAEEEEDGFITDDEVHDIINELLKWVSNMSMEILEDERIANVLDSVIDDLVGVSEDGARFKDNAKNIQGIMADIIGDERLTDTLATVTGEFLAGDDFAEHVDDIAHILFDLMADEELLTMVIDEMAELLGDERSADFLYTLVQDGVEFGHGLAMDVIDDLFLGELEGDHINDEIKTLLGNLLAEIVPGIPAILGDFLEDHSGSISNLAEGMTSQAIEIVPDLAVAFFGYENLNEIVADLGMIPMDFVPGAVKGAVGDDAISNHLIGGVASAIDFIAIGDAVTGVIEAVLMNEDVENTFVNSLNYASDEGAKRAEHRTDGDSVHLLVVEAEVNIGKLLAGILAGLPGGIAETIVFNWLIYSSGDPCGVCEYCDETHPEYDEDLGECQDPLNTDEEVDEDKPVTVGSIGEWIPGIMSDLQAHQDEEEFIQTIGAEGFNFLEAAVAAFFHEDGLWFGELLDCGICDWCTGECEAPVDCGECDECLDGEECSDPDDCEVCGWCTGGCIDTQAGLYDKIDDLLRDKLDFAGFANAIDANDWLVDCGDCAVCDAELCGGPEEGNCGACLDCTDCSEPVLAWDAIAEALFGEDFDSLLSGIADLLREEGDFALAECPTCLGTGDDGVGGDCVDCDGTGYEGGEIPMEDVIEGIVRDFADIMPIQSIMQYIHDNSGDLLFGAGGIMDALPHFEGPMGELANLLTDAEGEPAGEEHIAKLLSDMFGYLGADECGTCTDPSNPDEGCPECDGAGRVENFPVSKFTDFFSEVLDAEHAGYDMEDPDKTRGEYIAGELFGTVLGTAESLVGNEAFVDMIYDVVFDPEDGVLYEDGSTPGKTIMDIVATWADENLYETLDGLLWTCNHDDDACSHAEPCIDCQNDGLGYTGDSEIQAEAAGTAAAPNFFARTVAGAINWASNLVTDRYTEEAVEGEESTEEAVEGEESEVALQYTAQEEELVPDDNLRAAIGGALIVFGLDAEITAENIGKIRYLSAVDREIEDLEGLQHAGALIDLDLTGNDIANEEHGDNNMSIIGGLTNLESLSLSYAGLENDDVAALSLLTNLEYLNLSHNYVWDDVAEENNYISDISALSGMGAMRKLNLSGNDIGGIGDLTGNMPNLERLYLSGNPLSEAPEDPDLTSFGNLERAFLRDTGISGITVTVIDNEALKYLDLADNSIGDATNLVDIDLVNLDLSGNAEVNIGDYDAAENDSLRRLYLGGTGLGFGDLAGMTSLRELDLSDNGVGVLPDLTDFNKLRSLNLSGNTGLGGFGQLAALEDLREIGLSNANVGNGDLADIAALSTLRNLDLSGNGLLDDVSALAALNDLEELDLSNNSITSLEHVGSIQLNATMQGIRLTLAVLPSEEFKSVEFMGKEGAGGALYLADNDMSGQLWHLEGNTYHTLDLGGTNPGNADLASFVGEPRIHMRTYEGGGILDLSNNGLEDLSAWGVGKRREFVPGMGMVTIYAGAHEDLRNDIDAIFLQNNNLGEWFNDETQDIEDPTVMSNYAILQDLQAGAATFVRTYEQNGDPVGGDPMGGGEIQGSVTDVNDNPLAGATVTAGTSDDGINIHSAEGYTVTLEDGTFTLPLDPGKYELEVALDGYLPLLITDPDMIELVDGQTYELKEGILELYGDVSKNGSVDVADAIKVLRNIVGLEDLDEDELKRAIVSGDELGIEDAILILRNVVGLVDILPAS